ncbi:hypothetical protein H5410_016100 [Solanum commersonii]|uniref:Uncharacterized protein n=1 Tax=Solanum commersonii TaxID=4109 RepID=A0A9J5ZWB9_SOLCO|nr:hypothetical protein H5410_016100 [Solanum commersonii]
MKKHVKETGPTYAVSHNYKHEKSYELHSNDHSMEIMSPSTKNVKLLMHYNSVFASAAGERLSKIGAKFSIIQRSKDVPCEGEYVGDPTIEQSSVVRLNFGASSKGESMGDLSIKPSSSIGIHINLDLGLISQMDAMAYSEIWFSPGEQTDDQLTQLKLVVENPANYEFFYMHIEKSR